MLSVLVHMYMVAHTSSVQPMVFNGSMRATTAIHIFVFCIFFSLTR